MKPIKQISALLVLLIFSVSFSWAAPLAGHVILSKGDVSAVAEDGTSRVLKRRSEIFSGDTIKTGTIGSVQIRFIDKALMTIKANSEMNIESYLMAQQKGVQDEKVLMSLVKGGFRTITGTIGKGDKSDYEVKTPAASIGIRGTNYEVQQEADGGFVMGVYSGGITVENDAGSLDLGSGADFNFTRVKPNAPPKGLLAPPVTLAENSATEQNDEADESNDESTDDSSDSENEEVASEETSEEDNQNSDDSSGGSSDNGDDEQGKTVIAQVGGDASGSDTSSIDTSVETSEPEVDVDTSAILEVLASIGVNLDDNLSDALDTALTETIEETTDEFIETGGTDQLIEDALIEAGILSAGQTLADLDPDLLLLVEAWEANPTDIADLIADIQAQLNTIAAQIFDFTDPYANVDVDASGNPFTAAVISDEAYALGESGQLAVLALPINATSNYAGDSPSLSTEVMLTSVVAADLSTNTYYDYSTDTTSLHLSYTLIDPSTGEHTQYDIDMLIAFDSTEMTGDFLAEELTAIANSSTTFIYDESTGEALEATNLGIIAFTYNATTGKFEIQQDTSASSSQFISELELSFSSDGTAASLNLMSQLGHGETGEDYWYADAGLDLFIGNGSWDASSNKPILISHDTHTYDDGSGNTFTEERIEIIGKPIEADSTTSGLAGFGTCIDSGLTCDIQVNSVSAADNIRWGAWLAEPGEGIQITKFDVGENIIETDQEEQILAFWLAAERADINQLTGSASYSAQSNCASYSQCIGFADDGIVQNLTANFDVNFDTGAITNGNLIVETTQDPDLGLLGGTGAVESTWNVNFSGVMSTDANNNNLPEFQTSSLNGSVVDSANPSASSTSIVGNIGGVFVKPGDVFAGGYNLGTTDTNKHAAGVFSMEKAP